MAGGKMRSKGQVEEMDEGLMAAGICAYLYPIRS